MKTSSNKCLCAFISVIFILSGLTAQNPVIRNQFSADPTARVFGERIFLFPSHDIQAPEGKNLRKNWFCMEDYHVFSSDDLIHWKDHGAIVHQNTVPWVDSASYSMWAPDCVKRNGKYYFYFPANTRQIDANGRKSFGVGVAVADKPEGPYLPLPLPIENVRGIDPCVLIDKTGQAYLYWSQGNIYVAKLKDNMTELDSEPLILKNLPEKGLKEGPFVFERNGLYYLTYPHVENQIERLEYAVGDNPMGPFKMTGVIMDESTSGCWTNHHSIVNYKNQWYLFYHDRDYSPAFDKNRSVRIDSLTFAVDGTIKKVLPTLRGVGLSDAGEEIQIDRYSHISDNGATVEFLDRSNPFLGWKTILNAAGAWVQYNAVNFAKSRFESLRMRVLSAEGGLLQVKLNDVKGTAIANVNVPKNNFWTTIKIPVTGLKQGVYGLCVESLKNKPVEIDWVLFE